MHLVASCDQVMCVTFRLEEDLIFILGLEEVVADAAEELARFLANPGAYFLPSSSRAAAKVASKVPWRHVALSSPPAELSPGRHCFCREDAEGSNGFIFGSV